MKSTDRDEILCGESDFSEVKDPHPSAALGASAIAKGTTRVGRP